MPKHTRETEIESAMEYGLDRETAEALFDAAGRAFASGADLKDMKRTFHNMFVVAGRDPKVKADAAAAKLANAPDLKVGDRVLGLKNIRPKYVCTVQGTVSYVEDGKVTIIVDQLSTVSGPGSNWEIDPRVDKYLRPGPNGNEITVDVVTIDNNPALVDGKTQVDLG